METIETHTWVMKSEKYSDGSFKFFKQEGTKWVEIDPTVKDYTYTNGTFTVIDLDKNNLIGFKKVNEK